MITPGDISDELIEKAEAECKYNTGEWDCADGKEVAAAILNAAIEAGVVSPPCYVIRNHKDGRLYHDVGQVRLRPGKPQIPAHEHWKGQSE